MYIRLCLVFLYTWSKFVAAKVLNAETKSNVISLIYELALAYLIMLLY